MPPGSSPSLRSRLGWLAGLYVASGLPYGLLTDALSTSFARTGVSTARTTALVADVGLPFTLKFLWAPLLDAVGSRRGWTMGCQVAIAALLLAFSFLTPGDTGLTATMLLLGIALAAATQDVAIDAHAVDVLPAEKYGAASGIRVMAYRVGLVIGGGFLVGRADLLGWAGVWRAAAGLFAVFAVATGFLKPAPRVRAVGQPLWEPLDRLVRRPGFLGVAAFILLFKACDYAMPTALTKPFLTQAGFSNHELGDVLTPLAIVATVLGAVLGGWLTTRWGIYRALIVLGLFQAGSNLVYAGAAWADTKPLAWVAAIVDPFCAGLGTAPFLAFLMACCDKAYAASHFALLTALMGLGRYLLGRWSGEGTDAIGYAPWFALTFAAALPAYLLLPFARRWLTERQEKDSTPEALPS